MELAFYDRNMEPTGMLDSYQSAIWIEKFRGVGSLELKVPASREFLGMMRASRWIGQPGSLNLVEINKHSVKADLTSGDLVTVKGPTLEHILDQRVVYTPVSFNASLSSVVSGLISTNFTAPSDTTRKYDRLRMKPTFTSKIAPTFTVKTSRKKLPVSDILEDFLWAADVGYRVNVDPVTSMFIFDIYDGNNYTNSDSTAYVEFSREFDNLSNSEYIESDETRFTKAWIDGKVGNTDVMAMVNTGATGIDLREVYIPGSNVESKTAAGVDLTAAQYKTALAEYAKKQYALQYTTKEYSCEVDPYQGFIYGIDYRLGDVVMIKDQYGYSEKSRVTEVAFSSDTSKVTVVPTFTPDTDHTITQQQ